MTQVKVISMGGSIVAPDSVDVAYLQQLHNSFRSYLSEDSDRQIIFVVGGGAPARIYQKACQTVNPEASSEELDWIGIAATRLNGQLLKALFSDISYPSVVTDPTAVTEFSERIMIAAGWKPGFSTDYDAVLLADRFGADTVVNLSNIPKVYSDDPKSNPDAEPYDTLSWSEFRALVGDEWVPGKNAPFDPIAARFGAEKKLTVIVASGKDIENVERIIKGLPFTGTTIGPD